MGEAVLRGLIGGVFVVVVGATSIAAAVCVGDGWTGFVTGYILVPAWWGAAFATVRNEQGNRR